MRDASAPDLRIKQDEFRSAFLDHGLRVFHPPFERFGTRRCIEHLEADFAPQVGLVMPPNDAGKHYFSMDLWKAGEERELPYFLLRSPGGREYADRSECLSGSRTTDSLARSEVRQTN